MSRKSVLQCVAVCCSVLQCVAAREKDRNCLGRERHTKTERESKRVGEREKVINKSQISMRESVRLKKRKGERWRASERARTHIRELGRMCEKDGK